MFYEQLSFLCKQHQITPTAFVTEKLGLSSSKITAWKGGSIPKYGILCKIAEYFNVPISFLFEESTTQTSSERLPDDVKALLKAYYTLNENEKGQVLGKAETLAELAAERKVEEEKAKAIKLKSDSEEPKTINIELFELPASAGTGVYLSSGYSEPINVLCTPESEQANYAIRISGDSMMPDFSDGDIVLVESCDNVELGEIGIFVLNGESFIKENGGYRLISHNSKYKDILLKEYESISCRGRVLGKAQVM